MVCCSGWGNPSVSGVPSRISPSRAWRHMLGRGIVWAGSSSGAGVPKPRAVSGSRGRPLLRSGPLAACSAQKLRLRLGSLSACERSTSLCAASAASSCACLCICSCCVSSSAAAARCSWMELATDLPGRAVVLSAGGAAQPELWQGRRRQLTRVAGPGRGLGKGQLHHAPGRLAAGAPLALDAALLRQSLLLLPLLGHGLVQLGLRGQGRRRRGRAERQALGRAGRQAARARGRQEAAAQNHPCAAQRRPAGKAPPADARSGRAGRAAGPQRGAAPSAPAPAPAPPWPGSAAPTPPAGAGRAGQERSARRRCSVMG
jgi:hypothetical protein